MGDTGNYRDTAPRPRCQISFWASFLWHVALQSWCCWSTPCASKIAEAVPGPNKSTVRKVGKVPVFPLKKTTKSLKRDNLSLAAPGCSQIKEAIEILCTMLCYRSAMHLMLRHNFAAHGIWCYSAGMLCTWLCTWRYARELLFSYYYPTGMLGGSHHLATR